jgi:hypothetical protein
VTSSSATIADRELRNYKTLLPPPAIPPIATASEDQKDNDDNENEIHIFLQNIYREISLLYSLVQNNYSISLGIYLRLFNREFFGLAQGIKSDEQENAAVLRFSKFFTENTRRLFSQFACTVAFEIFLYSD